MSQSQLITNTNEFEIIEFIIDEKQSDGTIYSGHYAINVAKVLSIIRMPDVTEMPTDHDPSVLGTFCLRGKVLPLLNLATWLGKSMNEKENDKVIITEFSGVQMAFMVSSVTRIHRMTWDKIEPPDKYVRKYSNESITGIVRINDKVLFILDMERILAGLDSSLDMAKVEVDVSKVDGAENYRLLVADDSTSLRNVIKSSLEQSGFTVTAVASGKEAWEYLQDLSKEAHEKNVPISSLLNLVISDIEMPQMDGHELTSKIRQDPIFKHIPIILFSSLITDALRAKGEKVGADRQVSKPDLQSLNGIILELLEEKKQL